MRIPVFVTALALGAAAHAGPADDYWARRDDRIELKRPWGWED